MDALIDRDKKIIMDFTPKAGCTVAVKMFIDHMGLLDDVRKKGYNWIHDYRAGVFYPKFGKVHLTDWCNPEIFKFKVVRNPYTRAVSSYFKYLEKFQDVSFYEFIEIFLQKQGLAACDPHYQMQSLQTDEYLNKVVKLENFEEEIQKINELLNTNFKTNYTSFHHHEKLPPSHFIGMEKRRNSKVIPAYKDFYNEEIKNIIYNLYKRDFISYNYSSELIL